MELSDTIKVNAPRAQVFAAINDVDILRQAIPGCEEIDSTEPNACTATVSQKIGPLRARFQGDATLSDVVAPESYTLQGSGRAGPAGHVKVQAKVRLDEDGAGTLLSYEVNADIGGKLAQLGGSLVERTSKKLSAEFFARIEELIGVEDPAEPSSEQGVETGETAGVQFLPWLVALVSAGAVLYWLML